jgi:DNA topoisomerase-2
MVLINGTEGIGTGFSTFVPPYKPEDVRANVARCIRGEEMVPMIPFFNGFEGRVYSTDDGVWVTEGVYANGTITELPPGRWTQDHKEFLDGLVEKKTISGYENNSTTERVRFKITGYRGKDPIGDLKLQKTFRVSNMHLFHPVQGIKKYSSPLEIIHDFVEIRMECYQRRKAHIVAELRAKVDLNDNKARFIADVVSGRLVVFKRRRADLESDMAKSFTPMNGNFSYLLDIKTHQYTEEAIRDLMQEVDACKRELNVIMGKDERDMWLEDLREL